MTTCLSSNDATGCIPLTASCGNLSTSDNCIDGAKSGGADCFWNGSSCVDKTCTSLNTATYTTHNACYTVSGTINKKCTINTSSNACIALLSSCSSYTEV